MAIRGEREYPGIETPSEKIARDLAEIQVLGKKFVAQKSPPLGLATTKEYCLEGRSILTDYLIFSFAKQNPKNLPLLLSRLSETWLQNNPPKVLQGGDPIPLYDSEKRCFVKSDGTRLSVASHPMQSLVRLDPALASACVDHALAFPRNEQENQWPGGRRQGLRPSTLHLVGLHGFSGGLPARYQTFSELGLLNQAPFSMIIPLLYAGTTAQRLARAEVSALASHYFGETEGVHRSFGPNPRFEAFASIITATWAYLDHLLDYAAYVERIRLEIESASQLEPTQLGLIRAIAYSRRANLDPGALKQLLKPISEALAQNDWDAARRHWIFLSQRFPQIVPGSVTASDSPRPGSLAEAARTDARTGRPIADVPPEYQADYTGPHQEELAALDKRRQEQERRRAVHVFLQTLITAVGQRCTLTTGGTIEPEEPVSPEYPLFLPADITGKDGFYVGKGWHVVRVEGFAEEDEGLQVLAHLTQGDKESVRIPATAIVRELLRKGRDVSVAQFLVALRAWHAQTPTPGDPPTIVLEEILRPQRFKPKGVQDVWKRRFTDAMRVLDSLRDIPTPTLEAIARAPDAAWPKPDGHIDPLTSYFSWTQDVPLASNGSKNLTRDATHRMLRILLIEEIRRQGDRSGMAYHNYPHARRVTEMSLAALRYRVSQGEKIDTSVPVIVAIGAGLHELGEYWRRGASPEDYLQTVCQKLKLDETYLPQILTLYRATHYPVGRGEEQTAWEEMIDLLQEIAKKGNTIARSALAQIACDYAAQCFSPGYEQASYALMRDWIEAPDCAPIVNGRMLSVISKTDGKMLVAPVFYETVEKRIALGWPYLAPEQRQFILQGLDRLYTRCLATIDETGGTPPSRNLVC